MNERKYLKIKLIISIISLVLVLSFIAVFIFMPAFDFNIPGLNRLLSNSSFNGEDITIDETYSFTGVNNLSLSSAGIDFEIKEHDSDEITLKFSSVNSDAQYKQTGDTLYFEEIVPRFVNFNSGGTLTLYVPIGSNFNYDLDNVSGEILMENQMANEIEIDSVSGDIKIYAKANSIEIDNVSADIHLYSPINDIEYDTVSGDGYITADKNTYSIAGDSVSGSMTINAIEDLIFDIDFESVSGDMYIDQETVSTNQNADISLEFGSVSGSLKFNSF